MTEATQERQWQILHDRIAGVLDRFGRKNPVRQGDYWLLDENWGWYRHQLEFQNLELLQPHIVMALQAVLADFPNWEISIQIDVPGKESEWPGMGLIVHHNEVEDALQREFLPERFRSIRYNDRNQPLDRD